MTVEVRPLGVKCNIQCTYCYQNASRSVERDYKYDLEKIKAAIVAKGRKFSVFGGEAMMIPLRDLTELFRLGYEKFGGSSMQSNGTLIRSHHLELFKRFNVRVGISVDGPHDLNSARWAGTDRGTARATRKTHDAIRMLCEAGMPPGIIVTLQRKNALPAVLPRMGDWMRELDALAVRSIRLHVLEADSEAVRDSLSLPTQDAITAFEFFLELEGTLKNVRFDIFGDIKRLQLAEDRSTSCVWNACDPYTTSAVQGIEGFGEASNCGRTNQDGVEFIKAAKPNYSRYIALAHVPQEHGGCYDCRYFVMCKGQCPGTAIEGDWRMRTEHCDLWKRLFQRIESELVADGVVPTSRRPDLPLIEEVLLHAWGAGSNPRLADVVAAIEQSGSTQVSEIWNAVRLGARRKVDAAERAA